jgi:hypothetical protein
MQPLLLGITLSAERTVGVIKNGTVASPLGIKNTQLRGVRSKTRGSYDVESCGSCILLKQTETSRYFGVERNMVTM